MAKPSPGNPAPSRLAGRALRASGRRGGPLGLSPSSETDMCACRHQLLGWPRRCLLPYQGGRTVDTCASSRLYPRTCGCPATRGHHRLAVGHGPVPPELMSQRGLPPQVTGERLIRQRTEEFGPRALPLTDVWQTIHVYDGS